MDEKKSKVSEEHLSKSIKTTPVLILPNHNLSKQMNDVSNGAQYVQVANSSPSSVNNCVPKLSVHYIVSLNNDSLITSSSTLSSSKILDPENHNKIEAIDCDRKCLISLPVDNSSQNEYNSLKANQSISNQRLLISPTDFLTLTEEGISLKNSAVRKDVNLCASSLELIRRNNIDSNFAICLDRYCESPLLLENHKDSQLICEDDTSCNGRSSRLSETPEDMTADELFATTFGSDQSNTLREMVTPIEVESARNTPIPSNKESIAGNKIKIEGCLLSNDIKPSIEAIDTKPILTVLDPLETEANNCSSSHSQNESSFSFITSQPEGNASTSQSLSLTTLDIKMLPTGMLAKDSILLANLAAALPSSLTSRQIALQVIREDGTSLVLPINTKHEPIDGTAKETNGDLAVSTSVVLAEMVSPNASIRPFKCELCNSTFTRLGNYTRHKKIHSYPSKVSFVQLLNHCLTNDRLIGGSAVPM